MSNFVHGDNLVREETRPRKYRDALSRQYLSEIRAKYEIWKRENLALHGPVRDISDGDREMIERRVALFNAYKDFIDQQQYAEQFDSRSNLHSSALEEFMYYLFRDLAAAFSHTCLDWKITGFQKTYHSEVITIMEC